MSDDEFSNFSESDSQEDVTIQSPLKHSKWGCAGQAAHSTPPTGPAGTEGLNQLKQQAPKEAADTTADKAAPEPPAKPLDDAQPAGGKNPAVGGAETPPETPEAGCIGDPSTQGPGEAAEKAPETSSELERKRRAPPALGEVDRIRLANEALLLRREFKVLKAAALSRRTRARGCRAAFDRLMARRRTGAPQGASGQTRQEETRSESASTISVATNREYHAEDEPGPREPAGDAAAENPSETSPRAAGRGEECRKSYGADSEFGRVVTTPTGPDTGESTVHLHEADGLALLLKAQETKMRRRRKKAEGLLLNQNREHPMYAQSSAGQSLVGDGHGHDTLAQGHPLRWRKSSQGGGRRPAGKPAWEAAALQEKMPDYDAVRDPHCQRLFSKPAVRRHLAKSEAKSKREAAHRVAAGAKLAWQFAVNKTYTKKPPVPQLSGKPPRAAQRHAAGGPRILQVGDTLQVLSGKKTRRCTIVEVTPTAVKVHYERHSHAHDHWIPAGDERLGGPHEKVPQPDASDGEQPSEQAAFVRRSPGAAKREDTAAQPAAPASTASHASLRESFLRRRSSEGCLAHDATALSPLASSSYKGDSSPAHDRVEQEEDQDPRTDDESDTKEPKQPAAGDGDGSDDSYEDDFV
ncbi:hypothetical protein DIPPA_35190 [Diplonema papillatum]|nr:hypothetical protein DIPPA_35190 [Diplonema papillatum]